MPIAHRLERQADRPTEPRGAVSGTVIVLDPTLRYQEILGIGSSLEESTVFNLSRMSQTARTQVLKDLLDPEQGAGLSLVRVGLGSPDFTAQPFYSYDDVPAGEIDPALTRFSIARDEELKILDTLRTALAIQPNLKIFGSPWSPPGWMKTSDSLVGGRLKSEHIPALATYYRKAIEAYAAAGIPLHAITLQNEPLLETSYPSCLISPEQERELAIALRQELDAHGLTTKIWIFDHNFADAVDYVASTLTDSETRAAVDGVAFHDYAGEPSAMSLVRHLFPDKTLHLTERSVWGVAGANRIVQYLRNFASSYSAWVTMLDSNRSTHQWPGVPGPTLLVQDADQRDRVWPIPEYYLTAQFAKFIRPGAVRIHTNEGSAASVTNVAFQNRDGSIVVVVVNQTEQEQAFTLVLGEEEIRATLPARTVGTYVWTARELGPQRGTTP